MSGCGRVPYALGFGIGVVTVSGYHCSSSSSYSYYYYYYDDDDDDSKGLLRVDGLATILEPRAATLEGVGARELVRARARVRVRVRARARARARVRARLAGSNPDKP